MPEEPLVYQAFLSFEKSQSLTVGTREREAAILSMRAWWHVIFDPCPNLLKICPPDGGDIFQRFMKWADGARPSMRWSLHLHLFSWLLADEKYSGAITDSLLIEGIAAAASRWAIFDRGPQAGLVIGCQRLKDRVVVGWKCRSATKARTINMLKVSGELKLDDFWGCFEVEGAELKSFGPWQKIPL
jgi:methanobactin biosynthesis cassette protein MbnC